MKVYIRSWRWTQMSGRAEGAGAGRSCGRDENGLQVQKLHLCYHKTWLLEHYEC